ncbi:extracellular solute-binding protein [Aquamicrobium segne]|uniref:Extracellular solute-binding protein n=1 Tax=Aquamicrobium segne TaxID=469547 RepID=A0ABW0H0Z3_9HYPH
MMWPLSTGAQAETLRILTWGNYAPDDVIKLFEAEYPDINVEVTLSNNEEMIAKLRATGGAGFDLVQPGFNRVAAAQAEFNIYKPMDMSKVNVDALDPMLLEKVRADTTIDGEIYSIPFDWGTSGLMVDKTKAPEVTDWLDLCDAKYKGRTSMRLRRTILVGTAFALGKDPFAAYSDLDEYKKILDEVADTLIACKSNVKAYWQGGDDLSALMLSGEAVAAETWDSTAFRLFSQNPNIVYVPPKSGALGWIDTFTLPRKGQADEAAYKWINFVFRPDIVTKLSASTGSIIAVKDGIGLLPQDVREAVQGAFTPEDIANIRFAAQIQPGVEDIEGKVLEQIKAASSN